MKHGYITATKVDKRFVMLYNQRMVSASSDEASNACGVRTVLQNDKTCYWGYSFTIFHVMSI